MKRLFITLSAILLILVHGNGQGCVAIRSTGGYCNPLHIDSMGHKPYWSFAASHRYFKSYKHFVGTVEQKQRVDQGTEVINYANTIDLVLSRHFNERWSASLDVPVISNARSSLYEHDGKNRHSTHAFGVGDIRFTVYRWLIDPMKFSRGNIQVGLGIKLPTGDYRYQDFFVKSDSVKVLGPVDQSIQLGDGGTGFSTEVNAFYNIIQTSQIQVSAYGNFFYLLNPRDQNGTSTTRGGAPSQTAIQYGTSTMSVPDQYMIRAGANVSMHSFTLSAGVRDECLPSHDLIGSSIGFRRPGYIISFEPGLTYQYKNASIYAYVPVALKRCRTQSLSDIMRTRQTGIYTQGDAAFADYVVNIGFAVRF